MKRKTASLAIALLAVLVHAPPANADELLASAGQAECVGPATWEFIPPLTLSWGTGMAYVDYGKLTCTSASGSVWWVPRPVPHPVPVPPNPIPYETQLPSQSFQYEGDCAHALLHGFDTPAYGKAAGGNVVHVQQDSYPFYPMIGQSKEVHQLPLAMAASVGDPSPATAGAPTQEVDAAPTCLRRATGKVVWEFTKAESAVP